jgi:long-chain acyl-CoA synthetase
MVAEAVVVGDKRKFPAVLIFPNFAALGERMKSNGVQNPSREQLLNLDSVRTLYGNVVQQLNTSLAHFEQLKEFRLIAEELSSATDTLTASMKVRRRAVEERFRAVIDEIYSEPHS